MKSYALGFAAAIALGFASFSAPASAMTISPGLTAPASSDVTTVRLVRRKVCTVRTTVSRGPMGRRVVRKVRVCR